MPIALRCLTLFTLVFGMALSAQAQVTVPQNTSLDITAHSVCLTVTNTCDGDIMIPNASSGEFSGVPNVWGSNSCAEADFCGNVDNNERIISAGMNHACAIRNDRTAMCWGRNTLYGEVGDGSGTMQTVPVVVSGGYSWRFIVAGSWGSCGIRTDGAAMCWGWDGNGELGDGGTNTNMATPVAVSGGYTWRFISNSHGTTCGIRTDDVAMCWGDDVNGQLGDGGTNTAMTTPVVVSGGYSWRSISGGYLETCGIRTDGVAMCWGRDEYGKLGNGGANTNVNIPSVVSGGYTWRSISVGGSTVCGIRTDDVAMCWGSDSSGALGDGGGSANQSAPVVVSGGYRWRSISVGGYAACGIRTDGVAMCWGMDAYGALGDGDNFPKYAPVAVSGGYSWRSISAGSENACGIRTDGVAMCWGRNDYGQLGYGASGAGTQKSVPVAVSGGYTW